MRDKDEESPSSPAKNASAEPAYEPALKNQRDPELDANLDPITKEPGSHPFGTGAGAASGGVAGALIGGIVGGPVGAGVGSVVGGIVGGAAGKALAESIDPTIEEEYWKENHARQDYAVAGNFDSFAPAYRVAYTSYESYDPGTRFEEAEPNLRNSYESEAADRPWHEARPAAYAAWKRVERDREPVIDTDLSGEERPPAEIEDEPASTDPRHGDAHPHLHV